MALPIASLITFLVLDDSHYTRNYRGCDNLREKGFPLEIGPISVTLTWHRIVTLAFDGLENLILWFDSGACLTFNFILLYMLNHDTLIYWRSLDQKIQNLLEQVRADFESRQCKSYDQLLLLHQGDPFDPIWADILEDNNLKDIFESNDSPSESHEAATLSSINPDRSRRRLTRTNMIIDEQEYLVGDSSFPTNTRVVQRLYNNSNDKFKPVFAMEESIYYLQSEIRDFFSQVESCDHFISMVLTCVVFVWLLTFAGLSYSAQSNKQLTLPIQIHIIQLYHLSGFVFCSAVALELHRKCLRTYTRICSLMAYDQSKHKKSFFKILEFFTKRKRTMYTIFRQYPYSPTTFLSIIGWTFSCYFIMESLFRYSR